MRSYAMRTCLGLAAISILAGCSSITVLRTTELKKVEANVQADIKTARQELAALQKSVDDLNLSQGGLTSKMRADLTAMISELKTQIQTLKSEIDETQHRLGEVGQKLDKLDQRKYVGGGPAPLLGDTSKTAAAAGGSSVKVVEGLDMENLFNQAREDYIRGKYDLAFQGFKTVYDKDAAGSFKETALYWMGECLYKADKPDKAMEHYQRVMKEFPKGTKSCASRFKVGLILDQKKDVKGRDEAWKLLDTECPQSNEAERAREMMKP